MKITIPNYRAKSRNKTITSHWRVYQKYRDEIAELIFAYSKGRLVIFPARVTMTAYFKGKRAIDTSNLDDKLILDGLMRSGILKNDTCIDNPEVIKRVIAESGKDELEIVVEKFI